MAFTIFPCQHVRMRLTRRVGSTSIQPQILPPDTLVEEEGLPDYDPDHFAHVNPGDLSHRRWLAQDVSKYVIPTKLRATSDPFLDGSGSPTILSLSRSLPLGTPIETPLIMNSP